MAKKSTASFAPTTDENVIAAHQFITRNADEFVRHADTLLHRSQTLQSLVTDLQNELANEQEAHKESLRKAEARYDRDTLELKQKREKAEETLRKVVGAING